MDQKKIFIKENYIDRHIRAIVKNYKIMLSESEREEEAIELTWETMAKNVMKLFKDIKSNYSPMCENLIR